MDGYPIRLSGFVLCSVARRYRVSRDTASHVGSDTSLSNYCWVNISQTTARQLVGFDRRAGTESSAPLTDEYCYASTNCTELAQQQSTWHREIYALNSFSLYANCFCASYLLFVIRRPIISCDCRTCMEQSSYQHHSINLFAIFQETT